MKSCWRVITLVILALPLIVNNQSALAAHAFARAEDEAVATKQHDCTRICNDARVSCSLFTACMQGGGTYWTCDVQCITCWGDQNACAICMGLPPYTPSPPDLGWWEAWAWYGYIWGAWIYPDCPYSWPGAIQAAQ